MRRFLIAAALLGPLGSLAGQTTTIFSNVPGAPTSNVPGQPGVKFAPGTVFSVFEAPSGSPNGNWILMARTDVGQAVLILNGVVVANHADPAPWDPPNAIGWFDSRAGVDDAGRYVFSNRLAPNHEFVIEATAGPTYHVVAQEGSPMASNPGVSYGSSLHSPVIAGSKVGLVSDVEFSPFPSHVGRIEIGTVLIAQELVTVPANQFTATTQTLENIWYDSFWSDASGAGHLYRADLTGPESSDDVVVVNGGVVLQEGFVVPGSGFPNPIDSAGIVRANMDAGGNWYVRGNNDVSERDWVVRNGVVIAMAAAAVTPGSSEKWSDAGYWPDFFAHTGNAAGDYVVSGTTNEVPRYDGIVVWNGAQIVSREGDPVDVDGDGLFDDGLYVSWFADDGFYLSDANDLYFVCALRDGAGADVAKAFLRQPIQPCAGGSIRKYGSGCAGSLGHAPELSVLGCATPGGNVTLALTDARPNGSALLFLAATPTLLPIGGTGCSLLVGPPPLVASVPLDAAGSLTAATIVPPATPTVTVYAQAFDLDATAPAGFSSTNGVEVPIR